MIYDGIFKSKEDIENNFGVDLQNETILYAEYSYEDYSGNSWVIFEKNGELFEVHGSHCSCYGLEGQWRPEPANPEAIFHILNNGTLGESFNAEKIKSVLQDWLDAKNTDTEELKTIVEEIIEESASPKKKTKKTKKEKIVDIDKQKTVYNGAFNSQEDVEQQFKITLDKDEKILFADYEQNDYDGTAWVIFEKNGELFEAHGSHCSCYGLEDQWEPEPTTVESILYIIENGTKGKHHNVVDLKNILEDWQEKQATPAKVKKMKKIL